jgi:aldehyde:ferredoxin oxidoreductase
MALYGYAGKILRLDLTNRRAIVLDTERYKSWGGGHGLGSALFWEFCKDKTITDGRHPANVCVVAASAVCGTGVPSATGRSEVVGVGVGYDGISWFTRSGFGGRFSTMLKYAGWDAIVIEGKADKPVWVDIRNESVVIREASGLWGKDTWATQLEIWKLLGVESGARGGWLPLDELKDAPKLESGDAGRTTQKPAIVTIGPAGENRCHGALIHDAGNGAGQGGFGSVWGSKNLKAISVIGTGSIRIANPMALIKAREALKSRYITSYEEPDFRQWSRIGGLAKPIVQAPIPTEDRRPQACQGCVNGCRSRSNLGYGNESACQETSWYNEFIQKVVKTPKEMGELSLRAADLCQKYGINTFVLQPGLPWLEYLHEEGVLGPGKKIPSALPWDKLGTLEFAEKLVHALSTGTDIGRDLAEGFVPAARKWGREGDLATGALQFSYWGCPEHGYDPRAALEWGYGSIMGDRDTNTHCFNFMFTTVSAAFAYALPIRVEAKELVTVQARRLAPYAQDRPEVFDFSDPNMYSEAVAQLVRWQQHYCRFWKNSALFCDLKWPDLFNTNRPNLEGATGSEDAGEHVFWNAVTGDKMTLVDGIRLGRRIWNLDNAIWTLQGRHRDIVQFAPYIYDTKYEKNELFPFFMWPCRDDKGNWAYTDLMGRSIDRKGFEEWKTTFYRLEGWDTKTGWPTARTLAELDLDFVTEALKAANRLGKEKVA